MASRRTAKLVSENAQNPQNISKSGQAHKVTHGEFEHKIETIQVAGEARKKGFPVRLIIESGKYKLLFAEGINKEEAAEVVKNLAAVGIKSEIV